MKNEVDPAIANYLSRIGKKGGRNRAKMHTPEELSTWAKEGGRPSVLNEAKLKQLRQLREKGYTLSAISKKLHVSLATIQRAAAQMEK